MQEQEKAITSTLYLPKKSDTESKQPCSSFQEPNSGQKLSESPIFPETRFNDNLFIQSYSLIDNPFIKNLNC